MGAAGRGDINCAGSVVSAKGDQMICRSFTSADTSATALRARSKSAGNVLSRLSARRRIPRQAFGLKKYRGGTSPVSKTSDNEHTPSSLRDSPSKPVHSHELSVNDPIGPPIPEFFQPPEDGAKRPSAVLRQDTGDVLPNDPFGTVAISDSKKSESEVPAWVSQAFAQSRD